MQWFFPCMSSLSASHRQQKRIRREQRRGLDPTITHRNALVLEHYGLAHLAAQRQSLKGPGSHDDLIQEASLGLIKAATGYEPSRGHRFSSYGVAMAQGQILHYRRDREPTLHVPWRLSSLHAKGIKLQRQRAQQQLPPLSAARLAEGLGVSPQRWQEACSTHQQRHLISLHQPAHRDRSSGDHMEGCMLDQLADPRVGLCNDGASDWLRQALQHLPKRTRQWLIRHHVQGESVRQISSGTGLSCRAIRAELAGALEQLKQLASGQTWPAGQSVSWN
jgi:RNA polymerase sigma-B factor